MEPQAKSSIGRMVLRQRLVENRSVVQAGLMLWTLYGFMQRVAGKRRKAVLMFAQVHRTSRSPWLTRLVEPYIVANLEAIRVNADDLKREDVSRFFGNRLAVLKPPQPNGEKGVLFVMVSYMFRILQANMDMERLLQDYTLVFEPSWSGYCHPDLLEYTRWQQEVIILSGEQHDFAFLTRLNSNLTPLELGPCDWVDPRVQTPYLDNPKEFDFVMNSNWAAWKRHHVLFRMLSKAKRRYKVLLIGVKLDGKVRSDVEQLAQYYGVFDQLTFVEDVPYQTVMDMTCRAKVSILLSLKEGSNRAISESIFCNLPVIVLASHVGGIRKNVVPQTGLLAEENDLEAAINQLMQSDLQPRQWGIDHVSCFRSTERMNDFLRERAVLRGEPWTMDIAGRSNSPESKYLEAEDAERLRPFNAALKDYIR